jgi:hypothetical protein
LIKIGHILFVDGDGAVPVAGGFGDRDVRCKRLPLVMLLALLVWRNSTSSLN